MEGKHPKRKRDKYNPYYIYEKDGQAFIAFEDGQGERYRFEISRELYEAFDKDVVSFIEKSIAQIRIEFGQLIISRYNFQDL